GMITDTDIPESLTFQLSVVNMFVEIVRQVIKKRCFRNALRQTNCDYCFILANGVCRFKCYRGITKCLLEKDFSERNLLPA
ncbi:MAG: hypothetical protein AB2746_16260, partial [Candidatus Thiodiazotropha taylori]